MFQIQKAENSSQAVKRIIKEEIDETLRQLTEAKIELDTAVHETRKCIKRIRAVLRLIKEEIGQSNFDRENAAYRDAAREISALRDTTVMVETLDLLQPGETSSPTAELFPITRQKLVEIKDQSQADFFNQQDPIQKIVSRLSRASERVDALPISLHNFDLFSAGLTTTYRLGRKRMNEAYDQGRSPEKFHEWRKRVKDFWHQIELFQPLWPPIFEGMANELHLLSDYLGEAHDAAVLASYIGDNGEKFKAEPQLNQLLEKLHQRQQNLETAACPLGRRLYAEKPTQFVQRLATYWTIFQETT